MPEMTAVYVPVLQVAGAVMTALIKQIVRAEATNKQLLREAQDTKSDTTKLNKMLCSNASIDGSGNGPAQPAGTWSWTVPLSEMQQLYVSRLDSPQPLTEQASSMTHQPARRSRGRHRYTHVAKRQVAGT